MTEAITEADCTREMTTLTAHDPQWEHGYDSSLILDFQLQEV